MLRGEYMTEGKGFVLVYSITAEDSFQQMNDFKEQIEQTKQANDKVPICLVGNKVDLEIERKVTTQQGEDLAKEWRAQGSNKIGDIMFMETSAMNNTNVGETFKGLVKLMMQGRPAPRAAPSSSASSEPPAAGEPKTSGDQGGGCKCTIQ